MSQFQEQLLEPACCKSAGTTVLMILQDNEKVVTELPDEEKRFFMEHVDDRRDQTPQFLRLAAALCCCNGKGVAANQELVIKELMVQSSKIFVMTNSSKTGSNLEVTLPSRGLAASTKTMDVLNLVDRTSPYRDMLDYYEANLELFSAVCASQCTNGRTQVGGRHVAKIDYDCLLRGMNENKLPESVRMRYVRLMRMLYVERLPEEYTPKRESTQLLHEIDRQSFHKYSYLGFCYRKCVH